MTDERTEGLEPSGDEAPADEPQQPDEDGPDVSELDDEPDYNPDEQGLKDLKGG